MSNHRSRSGPERANAEFPAPDALAGPNISDTSNFSSLSDQEVWQVFKQGDDAAFIYIYRQYFSVLFRYGSQFTRHRELIKDCIQDLFIDISEKREKLAAVRSIKMYLFRALKNRIVAHLKKRQKESFYSHLEEGFDFNLCFSAEQSLILRQMKEEKQQQLNRAIQHLTPRQREIIYYVYQEGLSLEEVQDLMQLRHLKSAQNLLYKAVAVLKQHCSLSVLIGLLTYYS